MYYETKSPGDLGGWGGIVGFGRGGVMIIHVFHAYYCRSTYYRGKIHVLPRIAIVCVIGIKCMMCITLQYNVFM